MMHLWFRDALLPGGWARAVRVAVDHGRICTVVAGAEAQTQDERHAIGLPGLPNLHSHAFQRAMAGRAERRAGVDDDFWLWRRRMYELAGAVQPQDLQAIAALAYAEMLQSGFVRVGEFHYLHNAPDGRPYADPGEMAASLAAAAAETGISLTLLPVFYAQSGFGGAPPLPDQARFVTDLDGYARLVEASRRALSTLPGAILGVAPHSLRAVTPAQLAKLPALAPGGPLHIHIAEQAKEVDDCLAWSGQRPAAWLLDHAAVDARWCLVHATHVDAAEADAIAVRGAVVGLCPITEANLGDGLFPAPGFIQSGGAFGIGSDSNVRIDAAEELRLLEYGQRLVRERRNLLAGPAGEPPADHLHARALAGGAQALGVAPAQLEEGASATFVSLDGTHPAFLESPPEEFLSRWIFVAGREAVDSVWIDGRRVVSQGRHLAWSSILGSYQQGLARLRARLA